MAQGIHILVHADDSLRLVRARYAHVAEAEDVRVRFDIVALLDGWSNGLSRCRLRLYVFVGRLSLNHYRPTSLLLLLRRNERMLLGHLAASVHLDLAAQRI